MHTYSKTLRTDSSIRYALSFAVYKLFSLLTNLLLAVIAFEAWKRVCIYVFGKLYELLIMHEY